MRSFKGFVILLGVCCFCLLGSVALAFQLLYEENGKAFYETDEGAVIEHEIDVKATKPVFLYEDRKKRIRYYRVPDGRTLEARQMGGTLSNTPDYDWWYGCAPTSAGMMMGYYDIHGYSGLRYRNLVPGGTAELNTFPPGTYIANDAIASSGHIADFWTGYGNSGDDPLGSGRTRPDDFDSLADFMCTNQDSCGNSDGATTLINYTNGAPLTAEEVYSWGGPVWAGGPDWYELSGMYGVGEYVRYAGYNYPTGTLYNQYVYPYPYGGTTQGFTYGDLTNTIDAGRPALLHIEGHTMLAYGYMDPNTVYVRDTWTSGGKYNGGTMTWGQKYGGAYHLSMTLFTPTGGAHPPNGGDDAFPWLLYYPAFVKK